MRVALLAIFAVFAAALPTGEQEVNARSSVVSCPGCATRDMAAAAPIMLSQSVPRNETLDQIETRAVTAAAAKAQPHEEEMEVEEKTTKSGKKYHVHRPKGSAAAEAKAKKHKKRASYGHFLLSMYWRAGRSGMTDGSFSYTTGIDQWNIDASGIFFKYRVNFHTTAWWNYYFQDESGDWYNCNVFLPGQHYIDYNSARPNMIQVQGTGT